MASGIAASSTSQMANLAVKLPNQLLWLIKAEAIPLIKLEPEELWIKGSWCNFKISPRSLAVVVLPLVPVIIIDFKWLKWIIWLIKLGLNLSAISPGKAVPLFWAAIWLIKAIIFPIMMELDIL